MKRFAIRKKATGEFLGAKRFSGVEREWGHIDQAQMWNTSGVLTNVLLHVKEVQDYMKKKKLSSICKFYRQQKDFPFEIVEFNVVLIDAKKGYIG